MPKYLRKYMGPDGKWIYVYKPMHSSQARKPEYVAEAKRVQAYNRERVKSYDKENKPDFMSMPTDDLVLEYVQATNDILRFGTISKMDRGKMLTFLAINREERIRSELDTRGAMHMVTQYFIEHPLNKARVFTPVELFMLKAKKDGHLNPDNTFKGGFKGCTAHQKEKGLSEGSARKLCAYIGRRAGKIK